ncbi:MAG TPA: hypothetical protein VEJ84_09360 [Acidimicrobiales bacterium]|nr:hypothetical protein [Acidimicrobiales bacterium]
MTNPYALRVLAQAREEELRRSARGRHHVPRQPRRRMGRWSVLPKFRHLFRRPVVLRVVRSPLETTNCGG